MQVQKVFFLITNNLSLMTFKDVQPIHENRIVKQLFVDKNT